MSVPPIDVASLPVLLAGPMVRRLTRKKVSVWVALSDGSDVTLTVRHADVTGGNESTATATPLRIGRHLWVTLLTVNGFDGTDQDEFSPGVLYEYDIRSPAVTSGSIWENVDMALPGQSLPTFLGVPSTLDDFRFVHTSCRQSNLDKRDGLAETLTLLENPPPGQQRPHLMIMSGDQVYQDSVSSQAMSLVREIADKIVDIDETDTFRELAWQTKYLNNRGTLSVETYGLSGGSNHAWTLGEFCAHYLLFWSDVLWPPSWAATIPDFSDFRDVSHDPDAVEATWEKNAKNIKLFIQTMPDVRKVLANIPTLTMHDDHEVTDDWNLNYNWVRRVYTNGGGRQIVANGLLSYLLFQHWGNVPEAFETTGSPEQQIMTALGDNLVDWASGATEASPIDRPMQDLLALPSFIRDYEQQPPFPEGGFGLRSLGTDNAVRYDYRLGPDDGYPCHLVFLDEHTARQITGLDTPCARVSTDALDIMWPSPGPADNTNIPTVLVAPVPVLSQYFIEQQMRALTSLREGGQEADDIEDWTLWPPAYEYLLARISEWGQVIILSGDVHFGYTQTLTYQPDASQPHTTKAVQFVASGTKRADLKHMLLHLWGDFGMKVGLFRTREFYGYRELSEAQRALLETMPTIDSSGNPGTSSLIYDDMIDVLLGRILRKGQETPAVFNSDVAKAYNLGPPDWIYTTEHIDEEPDVLHPTFQTAINTMPSGSWKGWVPSQSIAMVEALRAADLHRIGRGMTALPQIAYVSFQSTSTLKVRQDTIQVSGEQAGDLVINMITEVDLG